MLRLLALLLAPGALAGQQPDSCTFRLIADLPYWCYYRVLCADANRNGRAEVYLCGPHDSLYALEHVGGNQYEPISLHGESFAFWAVGDADRDGKADLCIQRDQLVRVIEGMDSLSLPDTEVVSYDPRTFQSYATITDLDMDGHPEIVSASEGPFAALEVYENTSNNVYTLKARLDYGFPYQPAGIAQTYDMDRDGVPELVTGRANDGFVVFFESVGDDSFRCLGTFDLLNNSICGIAAAPDMDRDGRPEAIAIGEGLDNIAHLWVFESPANDSFEVVWSADVPGSYMFVPQVAVGDLDGDGAPEFAFTDGQAVQVYRCDGDDRYAQMWSTPCYEYAVSIYDLNDDGRNELMFGWSHRLQVYEWLPVGLAEQGRLRLEQVAVEPTVVAHGGEVRVTRLLVGQASGEWRVANGVEVEVLDVAGRTTATLAVGRTGCATWRTASVQPGAYFVRVSSGSLSVTRKVIVSSSQ